MKQGGDMSSEEEDDDTQVYKKPWVGLTPEEVLDLFDLNNVYGSKWIEFARTVEAALKKKNTWDVPYVTHKLM